MNDMMEDRPEVALHPPTIFVSALIIGFVVRLFAGGWLSFVPRIVGEALGGAMLLAGLAIAVASVSAFAEAGETLPPGTPSRQLLTRGPYSFSRNPIYLAMALIGVGFGAATLNLWMILATLGAAALLHFFVIQPEEAYLARRFGAAFEDYRRRVRRWI